MLSPEEIDKIKQEELFRGRLRQESNPERPRGFWKALWNFLNSGFFLSVIGALLLSSITWYWNHRDDERLRQREDSQFLATLLPYLTSTDLNMRLRTVDVIRARYPEDAIPPTVQALMAHAVADATSVPSSQQGAETKRLVANAVHVLERLPKQDASVVATLQQLPARVYLHIFDEVQRDIARKLDASLGQQGFLVPGIENVAGKAQPPREPEVRYFNDSDKATADRVARLLVNNGLSAAKPVRAASKASPGTIEVWLTARPAGRPLISSAPRMLNNGEIRGTNFGDQQGDVYIQPRIRRSALSQYPQNECLTGDSVLSQSVAHQVKDISLSNYKVIRKWQDKSIELEFSDQAKAYMLDLAMHNAHGCPVKKSDLEFGFIVVREGSDENESPLFFQP